MNDQAKAIVAHITLIGWVISLVLNLSNKGSLTSFYLRQYLGLMILGILISLLAALVPIIGLLGILVLAAWVYSLVGAISNKEYQIPLVGSYFQQWFKGL